jgi:HD-GYP domain-containing protein (c-di-GMP phosphodiesterase class II)
MSVDTPASRVLENSTTETSLRETRLRREFVGAIGVTADLFSRFATDQELDVFLAWQVVSQHRRHLVEDFGAAVALAVQPLYDGYPVRHSVQSSLLSMAMGVDAGFTDEELRAIGLGSLVHDAGMLLVPSRLMGEAPINDRDRRDLVRHPLFAAMALDGVAEVPAASRHVAAQIHERLDGSGYPHGLKDAAIHRLARYASVADAFLGMISPRPHRPAHEPYRAIEDILFAAHRGRFDSAAVRTLLRVVSLYPVGSCVWLSDGRMGRVVRSNPDAVDRPSIVALDLEHDPPKLEPINLALAPELKIVRVGELSGRE